MQRVTFEYTVLSRLRLTPPETDLLVRIAARHYDGVCRQFGQSLASLVEYESADGCLEYTWSNRDLQTMCKCLEMALPGEAGAKDLDQALTQALQDNHREWARLHPRKAK